MTKAITLHQPWATLIALGVKTIETRSWKPPAALIGERLLIHAGLKDHAWHSRAVGDWRVYAGPLRMYDRSTGWATRPEVTVALPLGAIVASCILADAVPMVGAADTTTSPALVVTEDRLLFWPVQSPPLLPVDYSDQRPYGDFAPGRWAYLLDDIEALPEPIPAKGHQRVWEWAP